MSSRILGQTSKSILGQTRVIAQPYITAILEGDVPGHAALTIKGNNEQINTEASVGEQILWGIAPATQAAYIYPAAAGTVTLVSTDATDNQAGVGARAVTITGLLDGYIEDTEVLATHPTDGTIAVTSAKDWLRINEVEVTSAGSSGKNAGNMTVLDGANIMSYIETGTNKSLIGVYTVPIGKTAFIESIKGSAAGTKNVHVHVYIREFGGLFTQEHHRVINNTPFEMTAIRLPAKTDFEFRVHSDTNGGLGDAAAEGWLESA
jgi:hypothetical protein